jgi:hypothetical protein
MIVKQTFRENNIIYLTGHNYFPKDYTRTKELIDSGFLIKDLEIEMINEVIESMIEEPVKKKETIIEDTIITENVTEVIVEEEKEPTEIKKQSWKSKKK